MTLIINGGNMESITVQFMADDLDLTFTLYSHFTCILGIESGEGKSFLFDTLRERMATSELTVRAMYPVVVLDSDNLSLILRESERHIVLIDEVTVNKNSNLLSELNRSKHLFVVITRSSFIPNVPIHGIYKVDICEGGFIVKHLSSHLPRYKGGNIDVIVTEASENRSENALLRSLIDRFGLSIKLISANGKDRIAAMLHHLNITHSTSKILVFTDLANISGQFKLLTKRCSQNPNVTFYGYLSFEQLLLDSPLLKRIIRNCSKSPFDFVTLGRYYERWLEDVTTGSVFEIKHSRPVLSKCYLEECCGEVCDYVVSDKTDALLNSDTGHCLMGLFSDKKSETQDMDLF